MLVVNLFVLSSMAFEAELLYQAVPKAKTTMAEQTLTVGFGPHLRDD